MRARLGPLTYLVAGPWALREQRPFECTLEYDGTCRSMRVVQVAVSNAPAFGGVLGMRVPGAAITDGWLDLIVVQPLTLPRRALAVGRAAVGRPKPVRGMQTIRVRRVQISTHDRQEITLDGELFAELPATLEAPGFRAGSGPEAVTAAGTAWYELIAVRLIDRPGHTGYCRSEGLSSCGCDGCRQGPRSDSVTEQWCGGNL